MEWETLIQQSTPELEMRKMELIHAIQHYYPIDRRELNHVETILKARKTGQPVPLGVFT